MKAVKDAFWQISGRIISAILGFIVVKIMTFYLGPLRFGDYSTIFKYFAIWSAISDFGIYILALKQIGQYRQNFDMMSRQYSKFVTTRFLFVLIVYSIALFIAFFIPSYINNKFIFYGLFLGMIFSALFMIAGILQVPLQIFGKMHHLTIALTGARLVQIFFLILIIYLFPNIDFSSYDSIFIFLLVLGTVVLSGLFQLVYVYFTGVKLLKFRFDFDLGFIKSIIKNNWKYGLAFYFSSFHILIVLFLLSIFYPTYKGYDYVGIWALSLALIEILLIVPTSLGNSIIHTFGVLEKEKIIRKLSSLLFVSIYFGLLFFLNFLIFSKSIIYFIGGEKFLNGSDIVLTFLGIVLILTYIKQVYNYIFVTYNYQNDLLYVNGLGLFISLPLAIYLVYKYNIYGGIFAQIFIELLFVLFSIFYAFKRNILILPSKDIFIIFLIFLFLSGFYFINYNWLNLISFIQYLIIFNLISFLLTYKYVLKHLRIL